MKLTILVSLCATLMLSLAHASGPDPLDMLTKPVLKLKGREPEIIDSAEFRPASREYRITKGAAILTYKLEQVEYCIPPKPKGFDKLNDVAALETIAKDYSHLWWDKEASRKMIWLYIEKGEHTKAVLLYKDIVTSIEAVPLDLRRGYWKALLMAKQYADLDKDLQGAIVAGDRETASWAYVSKGDMLLAQEEADRALVDGYLKTIAMFGDIPAAKLEALTKTVALMEKKSDRRVTRFQNMLKAESPGVD